MYKILKETGIGDFAFIVLVNMHKNPVMHQARKACSLGSIKKCLQKPKAAFSYSFIRYLNDCNQAFCNICIKYVGKQFLTIYNSGFHVDLGPYAFLMYLQKLFFTNFFQEFCVELLRRVNWNILLGKGDCGGQTAFISSGTTISEEAEGGI